ncbi:DinB family protein [Ruania zhangjianzhongii]|uniref:DinB family protein n=1 Tax=Ruania zhangjianzhongii TaxID=2603206 RepID=UPI0011CCC57A|nr:DinB family protein [Ruania zhangjianzhongii]
MATFTGEDDLERAQFRGTSLRGARFVACDLSGVVARAVDLDGADLDSPWLMEGGASLTVNGVDVVPFIEAELNRRFPGREQRQAADPDGLRNAWAALERTWTTTMDRAAQLPPGTVEVSVDGEWSFAQTLRHLVMATDTWLGKAVLELQSPYHPIGQPDASFGDPSSVFDSGTPRYQDVLEVRAARQAMVRDFLATVTAGELNAERRNPHAPQYPETVLSCLHTILEEEWAHHQYAVRDLTAIENDGAR